jgi:glycosyltransferase involved in cell wall biosynthesis
MRIALDTRDLRLASTGTKTYLRELLTALRQQQTNTMVLLELDSSFGIKEDAAPTLLNKLKQHFFTAVWKQLILPFKCWQQRADILICTDYTLPLLPCGAKKMVVFHDALFFDHPEYYPSWWLCYFKFTSLRAAHRANAIITPSEFSKQRLLHYFPQWASKIHVIHEGPKSWTTTATLSKDGQQVLQQVGDIPFFLHVGVMEKRKNLTLLIKAFSLLAANYQARLILVGSSNHKKNSDGTEAILRLLKELNLQEKVLLPGYLPDGDLPYFYKKALAYIFPSTYEGFGIPVLESFQFGLPLAVATGSSLPEVAGDAALQFDPDEQEQLRVVMNKIIQESLLRERLIQAGYLQLEKFSWSTAAAQFISLASKLR